MYLPIDYWWSAYGLTLQKSALSTYLKVSSISGVFINPFLTS